jgi:Ca2+-transporting ATPase
VVAAGPATADALRAAAAELAAAGLRVLAVAAANRDEPPDPRCPTGLQPLGLVGVPGPSLSVIGTPCSTADPGPER